MKSYLFVANWKMYFAFDEAIAFCKNNFDELDDVDFDKVVTTLLRKLLQMGIYVNREDVICGFGL